jgi:6-phospho-beta-glucosidase
VKVAILGGASARTPLLVRALAESDLPLSNLSLFDPDQERLAVVSRVSRHYAGRIPLQLAETPEPAIEGATFVLASIRVGGMEQRARDEEAAVALGLLGQETIGPAGFAMALRHVPPMVAYGRLVEKLSPRAFLINYTNPVGIVTQAIARETDARVLGICDTPTELFSATAEALGVPAEECAFDYVGLNHLGWLREVTHSGAPLLQRVLEDDTKIRRIYRRTLFSPGFLRDLGLLPTEYLYYYYRTGEALASIRRSGRTRGRFLTELNRELFRALASDTSPVAAYERYLAERDRTYFALETDGSDSDSARPVPHAATGYDKIALSVLRAIHFDTGETIPLNLPNGATLSDLEPDDVIEVPVRVGRAGARALPSAIPEKARDLLLRVKAYERRTVAAASALGGSEEARIEALASNPLVGEPALAAAWMRRMGASAS